MVNMFVTALLFGVKGRDGLAPPSVDEIVAVLKGSRWLKRFALQSKEEANGTTVDCYRGAYLNTPVIFFPEPSSTLSCGM